MDSSNPIEELGNKTGGSSPDGLSLMHGDSVAVIDELDSSLATESCRDADNREDPEITEDNQENQGIFGDETMLEYMGGVSGIVYSTLPVVVFAPINALTKDLRVALAAAMLSAVLIFVWRLLRKQKLIPAISGFFGVLICAGIALLVGGARGYFLWGIWLSLGYAGVFLISVLVRWPLIGLAWNLADGKGTGWHHHRPCIVLYDLATIAWAVLFITRYVVQKWLYDIDSAGWLAIARIGMGWPLTIIIVALTVILVRKADAHIADNDSVDNVPTVL